jgi:ATP-dependent Zn protease
LNAKFFRNGIVMLVLVVGTGALLYTWLIQAPAETTVGYSQVLTDVQQGEVTTVVQQDQSLEITKKDGTVYTTVVPSILTNVFADMVAAAQSGGTTLDPGIYKAEQAPDTRIGLILTGLRYRSAASSSPMRQAQGTNSGPASASRARMFLGNKTVVTFSDIAGVDER